MLSKEFFRKIIELEENIHDPLKMDGMNIYGITLTVYTVNCLKVLGIKPSIEHFKVLNQEEIYKLYSFLWNSLGVDDLYYGMVAFLIFDYDNRWFKGIINLQYKLFALGYNVPKNGIFDESTFKAVEDMCKKLGEKEFCLKMLKWRFSDVMVMFPYNMHVPLSKTQTHRIDALTNFVNFKLK